MQQRLEKEWELSIDPDTVRLFILKAKALSAAVNEDYVDGAFLRYGPVQAVEYSGERCGKLQAFWFDANKGESEFFDSSGRAVHGGWLRTPLRYESYLRLFPESLIHELSTTLVNPHFPIAELMDSRAEFHRLMYFSRVLPWPVTSPRRF